MPARTGLSPGDLTRAARDLAERFQSPAETVQRTGQGGLDVLGLGMSGAVRPWLPLLEAATAQTAAPARQLQAVVDGIRAQRQQVQALQSQLAAFDKQLATLEFSLQPLAGWGQQWVKVQESVLGRIRHLMRAVGSPHCGSRTSQRSVGWSTANLSQSPQGKLHADAAVLDGARQCPGAVKVPRAATGSGLGGLRDGLVCRIPLLAVPSTINTYMRHRPLKGKSSP
jgi:hypothetical protein